MTLLLKEELTQSFLRVRNSLLEGGSIKKHLLCQVLSVSLPAPAEGVYITSCLGKQLEAPLHSSLPGPGRDLCLKGCSLMGRLSAS